MILTEDEVIKELEKKANPEKAIILQRFFKTGIGEYGEGDIFLGIVMPEIRIIAKKYRDLDFEGIQKLIYHSYHEVRMCGFLILVYQYQYTKSPIDHQKLYEFYLTHAKQANNWDLVDVTCRDVIGSWLLEQNDRSVLDSLARSSNLWVQRISIISTWAFIRKSQLEDTLRISRILLSHPHDLIHKAVGWMLREVGKKDRNTLLSFLDRYGSEMSRTTLRYAIERLSPDLRNFYLRTKHEKI